MAKDPAFLFYPGDWLGGTIGFTRAHKGAYIDLLMAQFNQGRMDINTIQDILGSDFDSMWERKLKCKFQQDEKGFFYNIRLDSEHNKRKNFSNSRRNNLKNSTDMGTDMGTHMENENINEIKRLKFINETETYKEIFNEKIRTDFINYWLEPNKDKTKFRFEAEKFFDFKKRLNTFKINGEKYKNDTAQKNIGLGFKPGGAGSL